MSHFKTIQRILLIVFILCFFVFTPLNVIAQNFDDDPLMLEGDDEFGFEQFTGDDFQSSDFGTGGIQDFGIQPGQDPLDSLDSQYLISCLRLQPSSYLSTKP